MSAKYFNIPNRFCSIRVERMEDNFFNVHSGDQKSVKNLSLKETFILLYNLGIREQEIESGLSVITDKDLRQAEFSLYGSFLGAL
jgi:hypothetical protein